MFKEDTAQKRPLKWPGRIHGPAVKVRWVGGCGRREALTVPWGFGGEGEGLAGALGRAQCGAGGATATRGSACLWEKLQSQEGGAGAGERDGGVEPQAKLLTSEEGGKARCRGFPGGRSLVKRVQTAECSGCSRKGMERDPRGG